MSRDFLGTLQLESQTIYVYNYAKVSATSSVFVFIENVGIVLIRRKNNPYKDRLAFPGGFLDPLQEDLISCAVRELHEETGLIVSRGELNFVDVRSDPGRDPRGHIIDSGFFVYLKEHRAATMHAGDDAQSIQIVSWQECMDMLPTLAFDHGCFANSVDRAKTKGLLSGIK